MKHKHYDAIVAWANGEKIEYSTNGKEWTKLDEPSWISAFQYRVKKEPMITVKYFWLKHGDSNNSYYAEFLPDLENWHLKITYQDGIAIKAELPCAK